MDGQHLHQGELKRGLKNRHIQLIALGGAIGTGLFLGSAGVIKTAGPSMILGYAIGGFIAFLIMRQLGEMIVEELRPAPSVTSHSTGRIRRFPFRAGTTGAVHPWGMSGADRGGQVHPVLVAGR